MTVTGAVTVETQTTTAPSGAKSAEMGCGCNCGCKIPAEYVMAIVAGDVGALTEMAQGQPAVAGRSLRRKKRPKEPKLPRGSVSELTAALGEAGLQLPVECGCDCSCDVQDVGPMVASPPSPSTGASVPPPSVPSPTAGNSEAPPPPSTTTSTTTTITTTSTTTTEPG